MHTIECFVIVPLGANNVLGVQFLTHPQLKRKHHFSVPDSSHCPYETTNFPHPAIQIDISNWMIGFETPQFGHLASFITLYQTNKTRFV